MLTEKGEGATLPAVLQIKQGASVNNKYATSNAVATANNEADNDPYQLNLLPSSSEGGNILVADDGKTIDETIERIKNEAVTEVTPPSDPYLQLVSRVEAGAEASHTYAIVRGDDITYGSGNFQTSSIDGESEVTVIFLTDNVIKHQQISKFDGWMICGITFFNSTTVTFDANGHNITFEDGIMFQSEDCAKSNITLKDNKYIDYNTPAGHFYCNYIYNAITDAHLYFESGNFDYTTGDGGDSIGGLDGMTYGTSPLGSANMLKIIGESTFNQNITDKGTPGGTGGYTWFDSSIFEVQSLGGSRWALVLKA